MTDKKLRARAHHEAGHAVIGLLCRHDVGEVTIRPDSGGGYLGRAEVNVEVWNDLFKCGTLIPDPNDTEGWVVLTSDRTARHFTEDERHWMELSDRLDAGDQDERGIIPAAAGVVAQQKFSPGTVEPWTGDADRENAGDNLRRLSRESGKPVDEVWAQMAARVDELLDDPLVRRAVIRLARALLRKGTINGRDVRRVIRGTVITGPSWSCLDDVPQEDQTLVWNPTKGVAEPAHPRVGRPRGA